jgi:hypothetical protein
MKLVYSHQNPLMVHNIANVLENQGVSCQVRNEIIISVMGEGAGFDAWPEIWVEDEFAQIAVEIVNAALRKTKHNTSWYCDACGELNESTFEVCWSCHSEGEP